VTPLARLLLSAAIGLPSVAVANVPDPTFASVAPTRALADARAAIELPRRDDGSATRLAEMEATIARIQEAEHRDARIRDNVVQARFEETDRKILEVVGRLQLFVGCLVLLLVALFVWVSEIARRDACSKVPSVTEIGVARHSGRLG
jgi:hypothetical protein